MRQKMGEMGLERNSVASETEEDPRVIRVRELIDQKRTPSEISKETGLTLMGSGNIIDPTTMQVIGRVDKDVARRTERVSDWSQAPGALEDGISSDDGRGIPSAVESPSGREKSWQNFTDGEREQLSSIIDEFGKGHPAEFYKEVIGDYADAMALAEELYPYYQQGEAIFNDRVSPFINQAHQLYSLIDQAVAQFSETESTDARADNGGGRFALDEKQQKNRDFNNSKTEVGSPLKTLQGTTIKRYRNTAGKEVGSQVYIHKDYATQVVPQDALAKAEAVLQEKHPDFTYNTIMYDGLTRSAKWFSFF